MQTQELTAGRELDALIAEKVFGRMVFRPQGIPAVWEMADPDMRESDYEGYFVQVPFYSQDIAAAWQVVEQMQHGGWNFACDDMGGNPWWAEFNQSAYHRGGQDTADTAPLAICRAALAAVEAHP